MPVLLYSAFLHVMERWNLNPGGLTEFPQGGRQITVPSAYEVMFSLMSMCWLVGQSAGLHKSLTLGVDPVEGTDPGFFFLTYFYIVR